MIEENEALVQLIESNCSAWHSTTDDELFKDIPGRQGLISTRFYALKCAVLMLKKR